MIALIIVIPSEARDLQVAARCRSLASLGMTKSRSEAVHESRDCRCSQSLLRAGDSGAAPVDRQRKRNDGVLPDRPQRRGGKSRPQDATDTVAGLRQSEGWHAID